jgi:hypothetical protein
MAVDVHVSMVVAVIVEVGTGHPKMLYYNITSVYKRSHGNVNAAFAQRDEHRE